MGIFQLIGLLPVLINAAEVVHGAKQGQVKKEAVLKVIFGLVGRFAKPLDTPGNRELLSAVVDEMVASLNAMGVFPAKPYPGV